MPERDERTARSAAAKVRVVRAENAETESVTGGVRRRIFGIRNVLRLWIEEHGAEREIVPEQRKAWEEIFVAAGSVSVGGGVTQGGGYFLLWPDRPPPLLQAGSGGCIVVRLVHDGPAIHRGQDREPWDLTRPEPACVSATEFRWVPIPPREPGRVGARSSELARDGRGHHVTTLIEGGPGWRLLPHDHPVDVLSLCFRGGGILNAGGGRYSREPYQLAAIPAGVAHSLEAGLAGISLLTFVFPRGTLP